MTLAEFVAKWNGKHLDVDHAYGGQCVDVILGYCGEVLNFAPLRGNAIDEFGENPNHWTWVTNNPKEPAQLPPRGAVMIWHADVKVGTGVLGHTAVVLDATPDYFHSFDQNWPLNAPCSIIRHTYEGIKGWGIPKPLTPATPAPVTQPAPLPPVTPPKEPPVATDPTATNTGVATNLPPVTPELPLGVPPLPEPPVVAEAGVTTSEWSLVTRYAWQLAGVGTVYVLVHLGALVGLHVSIPSDLVNVLVGLEFAGAGLVGSYAISRGVRKAGTTG